MSLNRCAKLAYRFLAVILVFTLICGLTGCQRMSHYSKSETLAELESRYDEKFEILEENSGENQVEYTLSPLSNPQVVFTATGYWDNEGKGRDYYLADDYLEKAQEYALGNLQEKKLFDGLEKREDGYYLVYEDYKDIDRVAQEIPEMVALLEESSPFRRDGKHYGYFTVVCDNLWFPEECQYDVYFGGDRQYLEDELDGKTASRIKENYLNYVSLFGVDDEQLTTADYLIYPTWAAGLHVTDGKDYRVYEDLDFYTEESMTYGTLYRLLKQEGIPVEGDCSSFTVNNAGAQYQFDYSFKESANEYEGYENYEDYDEYYDYDEYGEYDYDWDQYYYMIGDGKVSAGGLPLVDASLAQELLGKKISPMNYIGTAEVNGEYLELTFYRDWGSSDRQYYMPVCYLTDGLTRALGYSDGEVSFKPDDTAVYSWYKDNVKYQFSESFLGEGPADSGMWYYYRGDQKYLLPRSDDPGCVENLMKMLECTITYDALNHRMVFENNRKSSISGFSGDPDFAIPYGFGDDNFTLSATDGKD